MAKSPQDNEKKKLRLGELLIREGFMSEEQLEQALSFQKKREGYKPLGEICVELKFVSKAQLRRTLRTYRKNIRIGDLLVNLGMISVDQLKEALKTQKLKGGKLGEVLVEMGFITEASLINALAVQLGVPKIDPDLHDIDQRLLDGIGEEFLVKNKVLPAFKEGRTVTVIMSNPLDEEVLRILSQMFKCKVEPAVALREDILKAIGRHFTGTPQGKRGSIFEQEKKDLVIGDTVISEEGSDNIVAILDYIVTHAVAERASDIHIEPNETRLRIRYRVDGILRHKTDLPISLAPNLISRIKVLCGLDIAEKRKHQDGRIQARVQDKEIDLRTSVYASVYGENVVIRILHRRSELVDIDTLGLSPVNRARYQQILDQPAGIILATGPTGSGKTTTLYASLDYLNDGEKAIITVEDPVEYTIEGVVQGQLIPKIGLTYPDFLKSMMRQDPDVIMVGEIRDKEAASAVIQAALTGHKVLSTFHTDDTTGALLRLMDMGIDTFLISSTIVSVIAQRLVRLLCPHCRKPDVPDEGLLASFGVRSIDPDRFDFCHPVGCTKCGNTGFNGRTAIHELLCLNDPIRDAILSRKTSSQIRHIAREEAKLISMREDGFFKATKGITSLEEVLRVVFYNESDQLSARAADDIVAYCKDEEPSGAAAVSTREALKGSSEGEVRDSIPAPADGSEKDVEDLLPATEPGSSGPTGEVYRIRFETETIESEIERVEELFKAYQQTVERMGKALDSSSFDDFVDFITPVAKNLESDYVEFCIFVEQDEVKILMEALVPDSTSPSEPRISKETGLRLINYLIPEESVLREKGGSKTGRTRREPLVSFLASKPELQSTEAGLAREEVMPKVSGLYKRQIQELTWRGEPLN
jgi:type IV pilus assembly protein PilB